jgi:hypothetical protein
MTEHRGPSQVKVKVTFHLQHTEPVRGVLTPAHTRHHKHCDA